MFRRPWLWIVMAAGAAGAFVFGGRLPQEEPVTLALAAPLPREVRGTAAVAPAPRAPRPHLEPTASRAMDGAVFAMAESYDQLLERQTGDPTWRELVKLRAEDAFAETEGVWVGSTQCGETLCRVEVQLADPEARQGFDRRIGRIPAGTGEAFVHIEDDEDLDLEVYVSRDDRPLPLVQNE